MDRNNAFANQNLNSITSSLKDLIQHGFTNDQTAIERTSAANVGTTDRIGNLLSSAIEQKILETTSDIKLSNIKDNNDTRSLINSYNNDNMRFDLQSEKIIHTLHHHGHYNHHGYHNDHYRNHIPYHNHFYNNYEGRRGGAGGGGGGD
jgi:hypothetical protein